MRAALDRDGAALWPERLSDPELAELDEFAGRFGADRPGIRLPAQSVENLRAVTRITGDVATAVDSGARVVRAILFDKNDAANWALPWHQDRTIEVVERRGVSGFSSWTVKQGRLHVSPPVSLLERMVTVRLHLDPVDEDNAPLRIARGSHRFGLVEEERIDATVAACGQRSCLADRGDVWFYATLILHASARAAPGRRRRVLQLDFSADVLPGGLRWAAES
jgi:ectoine hydroxylase-related dioxygenase (phytanoyl-CoA dioxygenase family)